MGYTDPALRERLKKNIMKGDKGGPPGKWSARKAQLLATEYKARFKGKKATAYKGKKTERAKSLNTWSAERWQTSNGKGTTDKKHPKYLPEKKWKKMTTAQKRKENIDKRKKDSKNR